MEKEKYQFEYYAGSNFYFTNLMFILVMFGFGIVAFISIYMDIDKGIEHDLSHSTLMIIFLAAIFGGIILYLIKNIFKEHYNRNVYFMKEKNLPEKMGIYSLRGES